MYDNVCISRNTNKVAESQQPHSDVTNTGTWWAEPPQNDQTFPVCVLL